MKIQYSGLVGIQETDIRFNLCAKCMFNFTNSECCHNPLFNNLHPCCSFDKYYKEIAESDIFNL